MARWTQDVYLMYDKAGDGSYKKLIDIKEYPDLGGEPEQIETTTLSELKNRTYIPGLQDPGSLQFTANYTKNGYEALQDVSDAGEGSFALWFGSNGIPDGADGQFYWTGTLDAWLTGKGVNEVAEITLSITVSSEIEMTAPTPTP